MTRTHHLRGIQNIPVSLDEAWQFFSNPHNLLTITPSFLNLKIPGELADEQIYTGQVMKYTVKPFLGIPISWTTEITHVEPLRFFIDEQRKGPYDLWHHEHYFKAIEGGVEMIDKVNYSLPWGVLGHMAHIIAVRKKLKQIFVCILLNPAFYLEQYTQKKTR